MLWLDHAAKNGAACEECLNLAELHSIAVDFQKNQKSGVPAMIPDSVKIARNEPRPHWRERSDTESYHCDTVVGKLYDELIEQLDKGNATKEKHAALAGIRYDRHGQITCFLGKAASVSKYVEQIYKPHLPELLGLPIPVHTAAEGDSWFSSLMFSAVDHRSVCEERVTILMNKYKIHSEGELLTGCVRKYHKLHRRRRHEFCEEVTRQTRELRVESRATFFMSVFEKVLPNDEIFSFEGHLNKQEQRKYQRPEQERIAPVERVTTQQGRWQQHKAEESSDVFAEEQVDNLARGARMLAAAYYVVTYQPAMRWRTGNEYFNDRETPSTPHGSDIALFSFPWIVADVMSCRVLSMMASGEKDDLNSRTGAHCMSMAPVSFLLVDRIH